MANWAVAKAKAQFSAVLDLAESEGPQLVERRKRRFILMTEEELHQRTQIGHAPGKDMGATPSGNRLWAALRCSPRDGVKTELERPLWKPRKIEL